MKMITREDVRCARACAEVLWSLGEMTKLDCVDMMFVQQVPMIFAGIFQLPYMEYDVCEMAMILDTFAETADDHFLNGKEDAYDIA
jgi:hypothetical protein